MTKPTKWPVRPANTQISLGIRPLWSESSLYTQLVAKDPGFLHDSEASDQTGQMPRLIWVFAGRTGHFVGFVMRRFKWLRFVFQYVRWGGCWQTAVPQPHIQQTKSWDFYSAPCWIKTKQKYMYWALKFRKIWTVNAKLIFCTSFGHQKIVQTNNADRIMKWQTV